MTAGEGAFIVFAEFGVKPGCMDRFLAAAREDARASVANEPGCRQFDVTRLEEQPDTVVLYEVYDDRAAFDAHLETPHLKAFRDVLDDFVADRRVRFAIRVHP